MATHSSILAWRIPWTEEPGGLQSMGSQRDTTEWTTNKDGQCAYGSKAKIKCLQFWTRNRNHTNGINWEAEVRDGMRQTGEQHLIIVMLQRREATKTTCEEIKTRHHHYSGFWRSKESRCSQRKQVPPPPMATRRPCPKWRTRYDIRHAISYYLSLEFLPFSNATWPSVSKANSAWNDRAAACFSWEENASSEAT